METLRNRRQHYRHEFAPTRKFLVRLRSTLDKRELQGELINLSVGGMCVFSGELQADSTLTWEACLPLEQGTLTVPVARVYTRPGNHACCGFRFVGDQTEEFEKVISKFLLSEQRRRRQIELGL